MVIHGRCINKIPTGGKCPSGTEDDCVSGN